MKRLYRDTVTGELFELEQPDDQPDFTHRVMKDGSASFAVRSKFSLPSAHAHELVRIDQPTEGDPP